MKPFVVAAIVFCLCLTAFALGEEGPREAKLTFSSFLGGGPEASVTIEDPAIVSCRSVLTYDVAEGEPIPPGAGVEQTLIFTGIAPGTTEVTVAFGSAIVETRETTYRVTVDEALNVTLTDTDTTLSRFFFTFGGYNAPRTYEIFTLQDEYCLCLNRAPAKKISTETVEALTRVIEAYDLFAWDGFDGDGSFTMDGEEVFVLDGTDFSLEIIFRDGRTITARGSNAFPDNYDQATDEIIALLENAYGADTQGAAGIYRYEGNGTGGLTLTLDLDLTFTAECPGGDVLIGDWHTDGPELTMSDEDGGNYNVFVPLADALVFMADGSDGFPDVAVPDEARFEKVQAFERYRVFRLVFGSFDGGGPEYTAEIDDPEILMYTQEINYLDANHEDLDGAAYEVIFIFGGMRPGNTHVTVTGESPLAPAERYVYEATVDENLNVSMEQVTE